MKDNPPPIIVENGIPKYRYWQGDGKYIFHPMQAGIWLNRNPSYENYKSLRNIAKESENGGLLWYYPNEYNIARMIGREVTSCISQAEFLTAFCKLYNLNIIDETELVKVFESFKFKDINDRDILLELPLRNNYPEVILNGWQHAIIRLIDYYNMTGKGADFVNSTLNQLSTLLPQFDDSKNKISKYSNLSPYRITVNNMSNMKLSYGDNLLIEIKKGETNSIYECQILNTKNTLISIGIPYGINPILINDEPFSISFYEGIYDPNQTTPTTNGSNITLESKPSGNKYKIEIDGSSLFSGYPTPFTKYGKNFYHVYHVVALSEIASSFEHKKNHVFIEYQKKWQDYIDERNFTDIEYVKRNVNRDRYIP